MPDREIQFEFNAQRHRQYPVVCKKCGAQDAVKASGHSGLLPSTAVSNKLRQRGWHIGQTANSDICPACCKTTRKVLSFPTPVEEVVPMPTPLPTKSPDVPATKPLTREDRRIIYAQLDAVYPGEAQGYHIGWNDAKVAEDLGVAVAWVSQVREEMFGPEHSAPTAALVDAIDVAIKFAREHLAEVKAIEAEIEKKIETLGERRTRVAA